VRALRVSVCGLVDLAAAACCDAGQLADMTAGILLRRGLRGYISCAKLPRPSSSAASRATSRSAARRMRCRRRVLLLGTAGAGTLSMLRRLCEERVGERWKLDVEWRAWELDDAAATSGPPTASRRPSSGAISQGAEGGSRPSWRALLDGTAAVVVLVDGASVPASGAEPTEGARSSRVHDDWHAVIAAVRAALGAPPPPLLALASVSGRSHILCSRFDWDLPICCVFLSRNNGVERSGQKQDEAGTLLPEQLARALQLPPSAVLPAAPRPHLGSGEPGVSILESVHID
jgi:hypothetical protein